MASKKVFTSLEFQSGAKLIAPKVELRTPAATLTDPEDNDYYTGSAGQLAYGADANLYVHNSAGWKALHHAGSAFSTDKVITSTKDDGAPFVVADTTRVDNLKAELLGSSDDTLAAGTHRISGTAAQHGIPVYGASGVLPVGTPAADGDAATKAYVDTTAQGLTIKDPVRIATTAALPDVTYANGSSGVGATLTADAAAVWTIDGQALVAGKRILVKDQAAPVQNGIYTVTTVGTGSVAAVLTRATDYDLNTEIVDGDFIFVERGTDNENKGFVQTANHWPGAAMGGASILWTQFSGAGQITAGDGLAKSGDTLSVDLAASTPLEFASNKLSMAAIDTDDLADDAVEPAKLLETGDFTMGGLTVNGVTTAGDYIKLGVNAVQGQLTWLSSSPARLILFGASGRKLSLGSNGAYDKVTLDLDGKLGIGADATSPSGTLHVSTARYGSEQLSNGGFDSSSSWSGGGSGGWAIGSGVATHTNGTAGNLTQSMSIAPNRKYSCTFTVTRTAGDVRLQLGGTNGTYRNTTGTNTYTEIIQCGSADTNLNVYAHTDFAGSVDNISIKEDSLAAGVDSTGDDLVINNYSHAGLSIISRPETAYSRLIFGDSIQNNHAGLYSYRSLTTQDSNIYFQASNAGTLATAMTLYGNDKTVKIEGGLGIRKAASSVVGLSVGAPVSNTTNYGLEVCNATSNTRFLVDGVGNVSFYKDSDNSVSGRFTSDGKLAIGFANTNYANAAANKLVLGASSGDSGMTIISGSSAGNYGSIYFGDANSGTQGKIRYEQNNEIMSFHTNTAERLSIGINGELNQKANSIVNSSTVQGLQDGACYDFDGTDAYIDLGIIDYSGFPGLTISCWFKSENFASNSTLASNWGQTAGFNYGWLLFSGQFADNRISWLVGSGNSYNEMRNTTDLSTGQWYHVVCTWVSGTQKMYIDGVLDITDSSGVPTSLYDTNFRTTIGADHDTTAEAASRFFNGQIRDFKIIPSELSAGEVRKLYSGENPKKNLNVELVINGDFDSATTGWAGTNSTLSSEAGGNSGNCLKVLYTSNPGGRAGASFSTTSGKYYRFRFWHKKGDVPGFATLGTTAGDGNLCTPITACAYGSWGDGVLNSTSWTYHETIFKATSGTAYITLQTYGGIGTYTFWDSVSCQEVGTLVDFNPRSASTSGWYNAAIPALYNGVLGEPGGLGKPTLSAGSTDHRVGGAMDVNGTLSVDDQLVISRTNDAAPHLLLEQTEGSGKTFSLISDDAGQFTIREGTGTGRLMIDTSGNTKVYGNLGIGTVADKSLVISGSQTGGDNSRVRLINTASNPDNQLDLIATNTKIQLIQTGLTTADFEFGVEGNAAALKILANGQVAVDTDIQVGVGRTGYNGYIKSGTTNALEFWTSGSTTIQKIHRDRTYILDGGTFGLGTSNPQGLLDVKGSIRGEADSYTKLLIHSDTTDLDITFVDSSPSGHTITRVGDAYHSELTAKFGITAMHFDGTGDCLTLPASSDWDFGAGDFTVDFWYKPDALTAGKWLLSGMQDHNFSIAYGHQSGGNKKLELWASSNGTSWDILGDGASGVGQGSNNIVTTDWQHIAVVKDGTRWMLFHNGVLDIDVLASGTVISSEMDDGIRIGAHGNNAYHIAGFLDEFRWSKGIARWTSNFTPPARPYSTFNDEAFSDLEGISKKGIDLVSDTSLRPILKLENTENDNHNAQLHFVKNRTAADGDHLGQIDWKGNTSSVTGGQIPYSRIQADALDITAATEDSDLKMYTRAAGTFAETLTLTSGNTKVFGKLGVGGDPGDEQLEVVGNIKIDNGGNSHLIIDKNAASDEGAIKFTTNGTEHWRMGSSDSGHTYSDGTEFFISTDSNVATPEFVLQADGNCGIGTEAPLAVLDLRPAVLADGFGDPDMMVGGGLGTLGKYATIGFGWRSAASNKAPAEIGFISTDTAAGTKGALLFATRDSTTTSAVPVERLRITSDGTQNHNANRIVNSQTVNDLHRTAEPSLRFGAATTDNVTITSSQISGSNDWSYSIWVKPNFSGISSWGAIYTHTAYTNLWIGISTGGYVRVHAGSSAAGDSVAGTVIDNQWNHVVVTADVSANSLKIYTNGVHRKTATNLALASITSTAAKIGVLSSSSNYFNGEIKDVRIHNRALEDTEVAAAYNGESTPFNYADSSGANTITPAANADFTSTGNWATSGITPTFNYDSGDSGHASTMRLVATGTGNTYFYLSESYNGVNSGDIEIGKRYRLKFDYKLINTTNWTQTYSTQVAGATFSGITPLNYSGWNENFICGEFTAVTGGVQYLLMYMFPGGSGQSGNEVLIDNISIVPIGEVATYTPRSIGGETWYDETSNDNHGTITGATPVNWTDHIVGNALKIAGEGDNLPTIRFSHTGYGPPARAFDIIQENTNGDLVFNDKDGTDVLRLGHDNQVRATSGSSTNLKQVARVETFTVIGQGGVFDAYQMSHGLGTAFVNVSVVEDDSPFSEVEVEVRRGKWTTNTQAAGTGVTAGPNGGAGWAYQSGTTSDWVTLIFATSPESESGGSYKIAIVG